MSEEQNGQHNELVPSGERGLITQSAGLAKRGLALADSDHTSTPAKPQFNLVEAVRQVKSRVALNAILRIFGYLPPRNKEPSSTLPQTTGELVAHLRQAVRDGDEEVIQAAIEKSEEIARQQG